MKFFTAIYHEECLYSIKARLLRDSLYSNASAGDLSYLNNFPKMNLSPELPSSLEDLYHETKHLIPWTIKSIINDHTLWPIYRKFIGLERQSIAEQAMKDFQSNLYLLIGVNSSSISKSLFPKYCPLCAINDEAERGEPYFRRVHQMANIQICPLHNCYLLEYAFDFRDLVGRKHFYLNTKKYRNDSIQFNNCPILLRVAKVLNNLLLDHTISFNLTEYPQLLKENGYFKNNRLQRTSLHSDLLEYYRSVTNSYLLSRLKQGYSWIGNLVNDPKRVFNPYDHILFFEFVCAIQKRTKKQQTSIFGNGPWPCYNKVCKNYLKNVIENIEIEPRVKGDRIIGVFKCSCGLVYTRSFKSKSGDPKYLIRERGAIWHNKFCELIKNEISYSEMSRILGTNVSTILKYLKRKDMKEMISIKRGAWLGVLEKSLYSNARLDHGSLYKWLFRYDREWLMATRSNEVKNQGVQLRLNWHEIDVQLRNDVIASIEGIKKSKVRITKILISKIVRNGRYIRGTDLQRLPLTRQYLDKVIETGEDFQLRRLDYALERVSKSEKSLTKWNLLKEAGIRKPSKRITEKVNMIIAYSLPYTKL